MVIHIHIHHDLINIHKFGLRAGKKIVSRESPTIFLSAPFHIIILSIHFCINQISILIELLYD